MKSLSNFINSTIPFDWSIDNSEDIFKNHGESEKMISYINSLILEIEKFNEAKYINSSDNTLDVSSNNEIDWRISHPLSHVVISGDWTAKTKPNCLNLYIFYKEIGKPTNNFIDYKIIDSFSKILSQPYIDYLILLDMYPFGLNDSYDKSNYFFDDVEFPIKENGILIFQQKELIV